MKFTNDELHSLAGFVAKTREGEISCETCEEQLAFFVEAQMVGREIPEALRAIDEHLKLCPECTEELLLLRAALADHSGKLENP